ncbi:MAG TPA: copper homeostasis membrane protein CopD [Stellaceae bacterium]|nr:copper homeostasis membrane protein CopD [Stellaceae bacterium]
MDGALAAARALHFAATISLAGVFIAEWLIVPRGSARAGFRTPIFPALPARLTILAWASLAVLVLSGAGWLIAVAAEMSGEPLSAAISHGIWVVALNSTRFGEDWLMRLIAAGFVALCLILRQWRGIGRRVADGAALFFSAFLLAALAWAGHGAATPGPPGRLHLAADILHLLAAACWLGTLVPLALLLAEAGRLMDPRVAAVTRHTVGRYSSLGIASVSLLLGSGIVNTWFLVGTPSALLHTLYGRLLVAKLALVLVMLAIAAVNLLRLRPILAEEGRAGGAARRLGRNVWLEAGTGLAVLAVVGVLGITPPVDVAHTAPVAVSPRR